MHSLLCMHNIPLVLNSSLLNLCMYDRLYAIFYYRYGHPKPQNAHHFNFFEHFRLYAILNLIIKPAHAMMIDILYYRYYYLSSAVSLSARTKKSVQFCTQIVPFFLLKIEQTTT
jgi:hypothetical protein